MANHFQRWHWRLPLWSLPRPLLRPFLRLAAPGMMRNYDRLLVTPPADARTCSFVPFVEKHCIFVHVPKAAGISVAQSLFGCLGGGHLPLRLYELIFTPAQFRSYFKFAFVRNPWSRVYSAYSYLKSGKGNAADREWAVQHLSAFPTFEAFVGTWLTASRCYSEPHFVPQHEFICLRGRLGLDFVGYYERLEADFSRVSHQLGLHADLRWVNRTPQAQSDYREHYTADSKEIVADVYRRDIELLGYDFDSTALPSPPERL